MPRRNRDELNRGRFQAQGAGLEKSQAWSQEIVPTKLDGRSFLNSLKAKLTPAELAARVVCFDKATKWVNDAPQNGYVVVTSIKTSFQPYPPVKDVRVDGELHGGKAFKD